MERNYGALTIITLSVKSPQEMSANLTPLLTTDYLLSLHAQSEEQPLLDQLGNIFNSMVDEMKSGMADNDLVRFVL